MPQAAHPQYKASERVALGASEASVTRMGVGCAPMGGSMFLRMSDAAVSETVDAAFNSGLAYFDTAPHYGQGYSEKRLGAALGNRKRDSFVISTKVGVALVPGMPGEKRGGFDFNSPEPFESKLLFTRESVKRSIESSLERLKLDALDIVLIHDPDEAVVLMDPNADPYGKSHFKEVMENVYPYLESLRSQHVIKAIGVGINQWQMLRDFAKEAPFDCFLLAVKYTLLDHHGAAEELLPLLDEKNIKLIIGGVYHNGILATGSSPADGGKPFYNTGSASHEIVDRVTRIEHIALRYRIPLQALALQFPLGSKVVASVIPGARNSKEVEQNKKWFETPIPRSLWLELKDEGLIHRNAWM